MSTELRHTVNLVLGTGITAGLALIYSSITARWLGRVLFGEVAVCLALIMAAQTAFGPINGIVSRFTANYASRNAWGMVRTLYRDYCIRILAWGGIGALFMFLSADSLRRLFKLANNSSLYISYSILFASLWLSVGRGTLRGAQAFSAHNANTIIDAAARLIIGVVLVTLWPQPGPALLAYLLGLVVTLSYTPRQLSRLWKHSIEAPIDRAEVRRFAWPMFALMLITAGFQNVDMLYVKYEFSAEEAGVYGAAFTVTRLIAVMVTPFNVILLPILTARHAGGRSIHGSLGRLCLYFVLLAAVPMGLFVFWPAHVVHLFSPDGYTGAAGLLGELALVRLLGHLCHMVALAGAAVHDFRFLYFYAPLFVAQSAALFCFGHDVQAAMHVLLVVHGLMTTVFAVYIVTTIRLSTRNTDTPK